MERTRMANSGYPSRQNSVHGGLDAVEQFDDCESVHNADINK